MWPFSKTAKPERKYRYRIKQNYYGKYYAEIAYPIEPDWWDTQPGKFDTFTEAEDWVKERISYLKYKPKVIVTGEIE